VIDLSVLTGIDAEFVEQCKKLCRKNFGSHQSEVSAARTTACVGATAFSSGVR
jgi:hypothetical protein